MSDDGTPPWSAGLRQPPSGCPLLDNPKRITPCALNLGIAQARGAIVMRMDAHAS